jgi:hypothetical protein
MREFLRLTVAGAVSITGRILWRRYAEQLTGSRDVLGAPTIGEESVVTDTVEPVGQHMDQEAADELVGAERHELVAGVELGPVIFPFEGHALAVEGDEPAVSNSDPPERSGPFRGQRLLRCGSSRDSPLEQARFELTVPPRWRARLLAGLLDIRRGMSHGGRHRCLLRFLLLGLPFQAAGGP